ncbi:hypothetical protein [Acidovorax carolinensis]|uniref:hypothetical protein n=1 Tax=Acidovorax carolinensis TaxID=553814 RepID=UPI0012FF9DDD|nr:hypothetical protein [Acidovorax carolinensis]
MNTLNNQKITNRERLKALREALNLTQTGVAQLLAAKTMRPCTLRTVQAWEANPAHMSARNCPDWVVEILTKVEQQAERREDGPEAEERQD